MIRFQLTLTFGMKIVWQFLLLITLSLVACRPPGPQVVETPKVADLPPFDPASQITVSYVGIEHARHLLESNPDALVLDVRPREEYDKAHLPKAVSFPYDFQNATIDGALAAHPDYDTKKVYFLYGSNENYHGIDVSMRLRQMGYQYLFCMNGGIEDWIKMGLPVMSKGMKQGQTAH